MLYFPQLSTGAQGQYPIVRREIRRTVVNAMPGGATIRAGDAGAASVHWELSQVHLTDSEWAGIDQLFQATRGRLYPFTFLDPADNLLAWSEDFTKSVWRPDPLLALAGGIADPLGGAGAFQVTNGGQAPQGLQQTVGGSGSFQYCFSLYLRSDAPVTAMLFRGSTSGQAVSMATAVGGWTRAAISGRFATPGDGVSFGIQIPPGARVSMFAPQVEAQPGAGLYRRTTDRSGVYPQSRFDEDILARTATGPNQNAGAIRITSTVSG